MKKSIAFILFAFICFNNFSQKNKTISHNVKNTYIKLSHYLNIVNRGLTKKELTNIKIENGDTLVFVKNFKKLIEKNSKNKRKNIFFKKRAYMPLNQYKKRYSKTITKEDSLNFKYKDKDTLILISNKDFYKNQTRITVDYEPKDSTFLETYKDVVYQKYLPSSKNKDYMRLWVKPIKIYFAKSLDVDYKNAIIKTANKLSKAVDSLQISFVNDLEKSNYIIYQIDDNNTYKYSKLISKNQYMDYRLFWNKNKIYDAKLEVNLSKYKNTSKETNINYLIQTFYKTLGRFYDSHRMPNNSILSKRNSNRKTISKLDIEILKYHYSYGICKFTDLKTFEENHAKAKEIINNGGIMKFTHIY